MVLIPLKLDADVALKAFEHHQFRFQVSTGDE